MHFAEHYYGEMGCPLPFRKLGYQTAEELLMACRPAIECSRHYDGELYVRAKPEAASHIAELVRGQRKKKKNKPKPSYVSSYQNRSNAYNNGSYNARTSNNRMSRPLAPSYSVFSQFNSNVRKPNPIFKPYQPSSGSQRPLMTWSKVNPPFSQSTTAATSSSKLVFRPMLPKVDIPDVPEQSSNSSTGGKAAQVPEQPAAVQPARVVAYTSSRPISTVNQEFSTMSPRPLSSIEDRKPVAVGPVFQTMQPYPTKPTPKPVVFRPMQPQAPLTPPDEEKSTIVESSPPPPPVSSVVDQRPSTSDWIPARPFPSYQTRPSLFRPIVQPPLAPPIANGMIPNMRPSLINNRMRQLDKNTSAIESECPITRNFQKLSLCNYKDRLLKFVF